MRVVAYCMSHPPHVPYLLCSLWTLRKHWGGSVAVYAWKESFDLVNRIAEDRRLLFQAIHREPAYRGKNDQFLDKQKMVQGMIGDTALYLDADTTIHGDLDPLFDAAESHGFCATQWNDWTTQTKAVRGRLESLREFPEIEPKLIDHTLSHLYPSVNGGVWAARWNSSVLPMWYTKTMAAVRTFIPDEKVLHLMVAKFSGMGMIHVLLGGAWNCSPKFQPVGLADEDVRIRHYHGDSCVRPAKSQKGWDLWSPILHECLELNVGGIREWIGTVGNRFLSEVMKEGAVA